MRPLQIYRLLEFFEPKVEEIIRGQSQIDEAKIIGMIASTTLVGVLPVPHPIIVRKYVPNGFTNLWFSTFQFGIIFLRQQALSNLTYGICSNAPLWNPAAIKMFVIAQPRLTAQQEADKQRQRAMIEERARQENVRRAAEQSYALQKQVAPGPPAPAPAPSVGAPGTAAASIPAPVGPASGGLLKLMVTLESPGGGSLALGAIYIAATATLDVARQLICEELDQVPAEFAMIIDDTPVGRRQEVKLGAMTAAGSGAIRIRATTGPGAASPKPA